MDNLFIPSILDSDPLMVRNQLSKLDGLVERIQIDFADNTLVENQTLLPSYCSVNSISATVEAHLMVNQPSQYFSVLAHQGFERVIVHIECQEPIAEIAKQAKTEGLKLALALNPTTKVDLLLTDLIGIDFIQVMGVEPGFGGQALLASTFDMIRSVREKHPNELIAVDGGVRLSNAVSLLDAGANLLVVGRQGYEIDGSIALGVQEWMDLIKVEDYKN